MQVQILPSPQIIKEDKMKCKKCKNYKPIRRYQTFKEWILDENLTDFKEWIKSYFILLSLPLVNIITWMWFIYSYYTERRRIK